MPASDPNALLAAQLDEARAAALAVCKDAEDDTPPFVCIGENGNPIVEAETLGEVITQLAAWGDRGYQALAAATQRAEQYKAALEYLRRQAEFVRRGAGEHAPFERLFWCDEKAAAALRGDHA